LRRTRFAAARYDLLRRRPLTLVREAMVVEPVTLEASATAAEAGERLSQPDVRAVLVTDGGRLAGVITRTTLVREVVAVGRDPSGTTLGEIAEPPRFTIDADMDVDEAFQLLEEHDLERVPVVDGGQLVGVLSRSVLQRRLAEDEPPPLDAT
jgi:CBS domain-containing protein